MNAAISAHQNQRVGFLVALALPLSAIVILILIAVYKYLPSRADRDLLRTCSRDATAADCYRAISAWSRASLGTHEHHLLRHLQQQSGTEAAARLSGLQQVLFAKSAASVAPDQLAQNSDKGGPAAAACGYSGSR